MLRYLLAGTAMVAIVVGLMTASYEPGNRFLSGWIGRYVGSTREPSAPPPAPARRAPPPLSSYPSFAALLAQPVRLDPSTVLDHPEQEPPAAPKEAPRPETPAQIAEPPAPPPSAQASPTTPPNAVPVSPPIAPRPPHETRPARVRSPPPAPPAAAPHHETALALNSIPSPPSAQPSPRPPAAAPAARLTPAMRLMSARMQIIAGDPARARLELEMAQTQLAFVSGANPLAMSEITDSLGALAYGDRAAALRHIERAAAVAGD